MLAIAHGICFWIFVRSHAQRTEPPPHSLVDVRPLPTEPLLQRSHAADMQKMKAAEKKFLDDYGWVDPKAGLVRIPIDRAMDVLAERRLPVRSQTTQPQSVPPGGGGQP